MKEFIEKVEQVKEGNISALLVYGELNNTIKELQELQLLIKQDAINEAKLEDEKTFEKHGFKIQYREGTGAGWIFKGLSDWDEKKKELSEIESKHKAAYQAWKRGGVYVDSETGEQVDPAGYREGSESITIVKLK